MCGVDEIDDLLLRIPVMIGVAFEMNEIGAEVAQKRFETLGCGDGADRGDLLAFEHFKRLPITGVQILQVARLVRALDNLGPVIVALDEALEMAQM